MSAPVRLAHLTTTDVSLDWLLGPQLRAFAAAGYEVIGISAPGPHVASLASAGIAHVPLEHATRSVAPLQDVRAVGELVRVLRTLRPTILHTHNPKPGVYGRIAGRVARVPIVVNTQHGLYATREDRWQRRVPVLLAERLAAACSDAELVQNEEDLATLRHLHVPEHHLTLLGNGIDLERFDPARVAGDRGDALRAAWGIAEGEVVCGVVGRLVVEKGFREVFEAAAVLRARGVRVRFVVVGPSDAAKSDALTDAELERARAGGVVLLGARDDVVDLYAAFDIFVLASHREGVPRAAMEAAAMGLPVIASDVRGCRQVVDDGRTGALVPARDPVALAAAIEDLVADAARRRTWGAAAAADARVRFDQQAVIDATLATYDRLLRARGLATSPS